LIHAEPLPVDPITVPYYELEPIMTIPTTIVHPHGPAVHPPIVAPITVMPNEDPVTMPIRITGGPVRFTGGPVRFPTAPILPPMEHIPTIQPVEPTAPFHHHGFLE